MSPEDLFSRAGTIGDHAVAMMRGKGELGLVVVTHGYATRYPVTIRSSANDGFGNITYAGYTQSIRWSKFAMDQADYAINTDLRSAEEQLKVLAGKKRGSECYGASRYIKPQWAIDPDADLVVSVVGDDIEPKTAVAYAETAIQKTNEGHKPELTMAATLVYMCLDELKCNLSNTRVAVAMIGLTNLPKDGPTIVCAQSWGKVLKFANYAIVKAKVEAVVQKRLPSGPDTGSIQGAVLREIKNVGLRVVAAGGATEEQDVAAVKTAVYQFNML